MDEDAIGCFAQLVFWVFAIGFGLYWCGGLGANLLDWLATEDYDEEIRTTLQNEEYTLHAGVDTYFDISGDNVRVRLSKIYEFEGHIRLFFVITNIDLLGNVLNYQPKSEDGNMYITVKNEAELSEADKTYPIEMGGAFINGVRLRNQHTVSTMGTSTRAEGWIEFEHPGESFEFCYQSINQLTEVHCIDISLANNSSTTQEQNNEIPVTRIIGTVEVTPIIQNIPAHFCTTGEVVSLGLNLRENPEFGDNIVVALRQGTGFYVTDCDGVVADGVRWLPIYTTFEGVTFEGWVSSGDDYVQLED